MHHTDYTIKQAKQYKMHQNVDCTLQKERKRPRSNSYQYRVAQNEYNNFDS